MSKLKRNSIDAACDNSKLTDVQENNARIGIKSSRNRILNVEY